MNKPADVLFVYTNINGYHLDTYSFGIGYLSGVLKEKGFRSVLAVARSPRDYKNVLKAVREHKPRIIGFSAVSSQFVFVSDLARMVKKAHDCVTVCGGVHPTIFPDCVHSAPHLDGIFVGESEYPFFDFVSKVTGNKEYKEVDNFYYLDNGKLVRNKLRRRIENLEELPFADREIYDYQAIIDENDGEATIMTSRGCPFNCTYCCNHAIARVYGQNANTIRHNSVEKSLAEIDYLKSRYKFNRLYFSDDLFILNRPWLDEFLSGYKKNFDVPFMCHIRPNICDRDVLLKLKNAGCYRIFLAVESANDYIRNIIMKRNIAKAQLEDTFRWADEAGIETLSVNIIGVPGETEETILEAIDFNKRMKPTFIGLNIFSPYEGTELGNYCRENGLLKKEDPRLFFDRKQSRLTLPGISDARLMELYDNFSYLVYKDINPKKAREIFWERQYNRLENALLVGPVFKRLRKMALVKYVGRKVKKALIGHG